MMAAPDILDAPAGRKAALVEAALIWNALFLNDIRIAFRPEAAPVISVVIVSRGARHLLAWTLAKLAGHQAFAGPAFEVILVDNASDAETRTLFDRVDGARILLNSENAGFGPACNQGAAEARGRYVLFLNPDIDLMPGALAAMVRTFAEADDVGIVGGRLVFPGGILQEAGAGFQDDPQLTHPAGRGGLDPFAPEASYVRDAGYVSGALLMIEARLFTELGGFDDLFAPAYFEDTDLCARCQQAGRRVVYQPRAIAIHVESGTSVRRADVEALLDRNRVRFRERHGAWLFGQGPRRTGFGPRDDAPFALRVLYVDDRAPHQNLGAGLPRANTIVNAMADLGYAVTVCSVYGEREEPATTYRDLSDRIEVIEPCGREGFRRLVTERAGAYDVLWVSRPPHIRMVCEVLADLGLSPRDVGRARVVFDSESLYALREFVVDALKGRPSPGPSLARATALELRTIAAADRVVCVSPADARLLRRAGVADPVVLGHVQAPHPNPPGFAARRGFVFIGSLAREGEPNIDSLDWFFGQAWDFLRALLPDAHVTIIGAVAPSIAERLTRPGVTVLGRLDEIGPALDAARVALAPARFAAGLPHKVLETVARGLPSVVTPVLAGQMGWPDGIGYQVHDWHDPRGFAETLAHLHADAAAWTQVQCAGLAQVGRDEDPAAYRAVLRQVCEAPTFP
ncbi:glycosyl transferase [Methylobacterium sp. Leaf111]|uniref:glycosyltransferase n=1 Tax=Methylobacterium sp. Leaf111 TaxID=1736257 RepID=UPI0006F201B3|nr:glycosyltransferase [Methylobacterium sp. Leaf111]KQP72461.1 glycosyl transferase [Methylobacterium sp. Leaf111]